LNRFRKSITMTEAVDVSQRDLTTGGELEWRAESKKTVRNPFRLRPARKSAGSCIKRDRARLVTAAITKELLGASGL
jgi:hypothetical protein